MKKWIIMTVIAGIAIRIARKYNLGLKDLKNKIAPKLGNWASTAKFT